MRGIRKKVLVLAASVAVLGGFIGLTASPALAEPIVSASDVSASITGTPPAPSGVFSVTATITNSGLLAQLGTSTLTISADNGSVSGGGTGCSGTGTVVCSVSNLASGASQGWTLTVTPNAGAVTVRTTATAQSALPEVNVLPDSANNTAYVDTGIVYTVADVAISSNPATVRNGDDTLLTASAKNTGAPQNITLTVATGGVHDPALALPSGCSASNGGATVTCTAFYVTGQTRSYDIAVETPATGNSMTSTATATGALGGSASASTTTGLYDDATAFVPPNGCLGDVFSVYTSDFCIGNNPGLFLDLNEVTLPPGTMCGPDPCRQKAPQALFPNSGTYSGQDINEPFLWEIGVGQLRCNGNQYGAGNNCPVGQVYVIPSTGPSAGQVIAAEKCLTFGLNDATLRNLDEVCIQKAVKNGDDWTITMALLRDIEIPIIGSALR